MITVNGLSKSYGAQTLFDNVTVKFTPGNRYGLTGPNGSGKTTLLKIIAGLMQPDAGTVFFEGIMGSVKYNNCCREIA